MKTVGVNMRDVKTTNRAYVLKLLFGEGALSRTDIASKLQLTTATLTSICNEFIDKGLILQRDEISEPAKVGRKKYPIEINYNLKYVVAIDIHSKYTTISVTNLKGDLIGSQTLDLKRSLPPEDFLKLVASDSIRLLWNNNITTDKILGAGVTLIGPVNHIDGISLHAFNVFDRPVSIKKILEKEFSFPVCVESNVAAYLEAELLYRASEHPKLLQNVLMLKWGPGAGSAACIDGNIYKGSQFHSSEIGHTRISLHGKPCQCGRTGCLETEISIDALTARFKAKEPLGSADTALVETYGLPSLDNITEFIASDSPMVRDFLDYSFDHLSFALDNTLQILVPDKVILCGDFFENDTVLNDFIDRFVSLYPDKDRSIFERSRLTAKSRYIGATAIAVDELLIKNGAISI